MSVGKGKRWGVYLVLTSGVRVKDKIACTHPVEIQHNSIYIIIVFNS